MAEEMMPESLQQFFQLASQDQKLQSKLKAAPNREAYISTVVELGHEKGYSFTSDQVVSALDTAASAEKGKNSYSGELDESELETVAGGFDIFEDPVETATDVVEGGEDVAEERPPLADITEAIGEQDTEAQQEIDNLENMGEGVPGAGPQPGDEPAPSEEDLEENAENIPLV